MLKYIEEVFFGRSHGTTRKILVFPLFSKFCSKKAVLPPPTTFFLSQVLSTLSGLRLQRHSVAKEAQLGTVKG